jgi:hypothetical protein
LVFPEAHCQSPAEGVPKSAVQGYQDLVALLCPGLGECIESFVRGEHAGCDVPEVDESGLVAVSELRMLRRSGRILDHVHLEAVLG